MKKNPKIFIPALALCMLPVTYIVLSLIAGAYTSFSDRWMSGSGILVIGVVLLAYWWSDGRDPMAPGDRLRYSAMAAAINGLNGYLNFMAVTRAWRNAGLPADQQGFFYQFFNPSVLGEIGQTYSSGGHSSGMGWVGSAVVGAFAGGLVTYYGFKWWNENVQPPAA